MALASCMTYISKYRSSFQVIVWFCTYLWYWAKLHLTQSFLCSISYGKVIITYLYKASYVKCLIFTKFTSLIFLWILGISDRLQIIVTVILYIYIQPCAMQDFIEFFVFLFKIISILIINNHTIRIPALIISTKIL